MGPISDRVIGLSASSLAPFGKAVNAQEPRLGQSPSGALRATVIGQGWRGRLACSIAALPPFGADVRQKPGRGSAAAAVLYRVAAGAARRRPNAPLEGVRSPVAWSENNLLVHGLLPVSDGYVPAVPSFFTLSWTEGGGRVNRW